MSRVFRCNGKRNKLKNQRNCECACREQSRFPKGHDDATLHDAKPDEKQTY